MLFSPVSPGNAAKDIDVPLTVVQQGAGLHSKSQPVTLVA